MKHHKRSLSKTAVHHAMLPHNHNCTHHASNAGPSAVHARQQRRVLARQPTSCRPPCVTHCWVTSRSREERTRVVNHASLVPVASNRTMPENLLDGLLCQQHQTIARRQDVLRCRLHTFNAVMSTLHHEAHTTPSLIHLHLVWLHHGAQRGLNPYENVTSSDAGGNTKQNKTMQDLCLHNAPMLALRARQ
jgi:hypothetical protein